MKKPIKIILIVLGILLLLAVIGFAAWRIIKSGNEAAIDDYYDCLENCDSAGAQEKIDKIIGKNSQKENMLLKITKMKDFLSLYGEGKWQEAADLYNGDGGFIYNGKLSAMYSDCWYNLIVLQAESALEKGETADAITILQSFNNHFYGNSFFDSNEKIHVGKFSTYEDFFSENAEKYLDLTAIAAEQALSSGDVELIMMLEGFRSTERYTVSFDEYPWAGDYNVWEANKQDAENEEAKDDLMRQMLEAAAGGMGNYKPTGEVELGFTGSGITYKILAAEMVSDGTQFGIYMIPVGGALSQSTGTINSFGMESFEAAVKAFAIDLEGEIIQPVSTNAKTDVTNPENSRIIYLFNSEEAPETIYIYPTDNMNGGVLIALAELSTEKSADELNWDD